MFREQARLAGLTSLEVSEFEPALSTKTPIDSPARQHHAGHLTAKLLFQRGPPGHELETETIVDHRKPAGTQGDLRRGWIASFSHASLS